MRQHFFRVSLPALAILAGAVTARGASAELLPAIDDKWRHYRSPNFELYSHASEYESRGLLHDLELVRAVFIDRFKVVERARLDVTAYLFRSEAEFRAYGSDQWSKDHAFRGVYVPGLDRAVISLAPLVGDIDRSRSTIFHEYIHHLFRAAEQDPPIWFNEGMAELLSSIKVIGETMEIGRPHDRRLMALQHERLLPLETLFAVDHGSPIYRSNDHTGIFYAESWALLHYWYFGESGFSKDAVTRFLRVASDRKALATVNLRAFFKECFGLDYPEMQRRLETYVVGGRYKFGRQPAPKVEPEKNYAMRPAPREEARVRLAELACRINASAMGKYVLLDASQQAGAEPRLFEVLGAVAAQEGEGERMQEYWEQAVAAGSTNVAVLRELILRESRTWLRDFDFYFQLPAEIGQRLRERLLRTIEREPEQTAPYEFLAWVEAFSAEPVLGNVNLVQRRFPLLKNQERTLLALAFVRVRLKMNDEAREMLALLDQMVLDDWTADAAEIVRAKLEGRAPGRPMGRRKQNLQAVELSAELPADRQMKVPSIELPPKP